LGKGKIMKTVKKILHITQITIDIIIIILCVILLSFLYGCQVVRQPQKAMPKPDFKAIYIGTILNNDGIGLSNAIRFNDIGVNLSYLNSIKGYNQVSSGVQLYYDIQQLYLTFGINTQIQYKPIFDYELKNHVKVKPTFLIGAGFLINDFIWSVNYNDGLLLQVGIKL